MIIEHVDGKLLVGEEGPLTIVTINRAEAKNACEVAMVKGLYEIFMAFEAKDSQRVAVLTGAGGSFCAGADLKEVASGVAIGYSWAGKDKGATRRRLVKPVIAAVEGHAVAAGLALAVWCDLRVASDSAVFGVFCRRFGGPMPNGATVHLPRIVGESRALDMMMTGRPVNADDAMQIGLADRRCADGEALSEAKIAGFPQAALLSDRESIITQWDYESETAIDQCIAGADKAFQAEFQSGAGRFIGGAGRHGRFE
ncbi:MAG: crotonase/enoyl-CoA hydratase family protein [Hyphomicrobiaceae bacterium]